MRSPGPGQGAGGSWKLLNPIKKQQRGSADLCFERLTQHPKAGGTAGTLSFDFDKDCI